MKRNILLTTLLLTAFISYSMDAQSLLQKQKSAFMSDAFQLIGFGQAIWNFSEHTNSGIAKSPTNSTIELARTILIANGKLGPNNQFGYSIMFDLGPNTALHEVYGEWLPMDAINVRFGQFKIPFTIENPMAPIAWETIYLSRSASAMCGSVGDYNQFGVDGPLGKSIVPKIGRDAGLQLSGKLFKKDNYFHLEYYAGLFNGTGMNTKDNNNHKDFVGTAYYQPIKDLRIGGSYYNGKLLYALGEMPVANHTRDRFAVSAEYNSKYFYGRSEYIGAKDGEINRNGFYCSAVWKFIPQKWEAVVKYDFYDKDMDISDNEVSDITAGINFYFALFSRIQLNYIYTDDKVLGKNNAVATQLQLFF
ncbi:MAG: OprO/OprP family phosphate-selective porin [Ignavibacteria bacterium]|jgi:hypothetical protein|nr:OprO/OprP family phosphate-selective porin [Ignavibacteria bacterium]